METHGVISYEGEIMSILERDEGIVVQELDLEKQRRYRRQMPVLEQMR